MGELTYIAIAILLAMAGGLKLFALSANASVTRIPAGGFFTHPVAAGVHIYRDALVGKDPAGYVKPFEPGDEFVGIADEEVDNSSGDAGDADVDVMLGVPIVFTLAGVAQKNVGAAAYATADNAIALTGHPDAYIGRVMGVDSTNLAIVMLKQPGDKPAANEGSIELILTGHENFAATGATAGTTSVGGFDLKSILGTGWVCNDAEDGGIKGDFDATSEVALCSARARNDCLPADKGVTFDVDLCVADGGAAAVDVDFGLGTALTTNSEANVDHADMVQLACFHIDAGSDNVLFQSDNNTTDVAAVDTGVDNDSTTDTFKHYKIIVRPDGEVEVWIDGVRKLSTTSFAVLSTAVLAPFINMEKTADAATASLIFKNLRVAAGMAA